MYIMYVDESGDSGLLRSPTTHFALSGIVVHETDWRTFIDAMLNFRRTMRRVYGLPIRAEIHASEYINSPVFSLARHVRLAILRHLLDELATLPYISITNIILSKAGKGPNYNVFENAWQILFQRFENTLTRGNFPGGHRGDYGMVITDATAGMQLMRLTRRMAAFNYIPHTQYYGTGSRNVPIIRIIEDPYGKDSRQTLPIQACDVCAYFLLKKFNPSRYIARQHAQNYIDRLLPVLNRRASLSHPLGIKVL